MSEVVHLMPDFTKEDVTRFWSYVKLTANQYVCWEWTAYKNNLGYGRFRIQYKTLKAHRVAYFLSTGKDPAKLRVCHTCDNPSCVNPNHLFLGTMGDNIKDMRAKGRGNKGETQGHSKLTSEQVLQIRSLYASGKYTYKYLSKMFNVTMSPIGHIVTRITWKHI